MGFLKSLFGSTPRAQQLAVITEDGRWYGINGINHYQDAVRPIIHRSVPDFRYQHDVDLKVTLVPDPSIEYVENAVRVDLGGRRIGHLPAQITPDVNELIARAVAQGGQPSLVVGAKFSWDVKAGPFDGRVRLPRNFATAQLLPESQVNFV